MLAKSRDKMIAKSVVELIQILNSQKDESEMLIHLFSILHKTDATRLYFENRIREEQIKIIAINDFISLLGPGYVYLGVKGGYPNNIRTRKY
ncbi:hypothetical protein [Chengkuizengella axinellae]|uniref:Uncharacterized protein n=1 Tax=Chengkuizengella axinellae TaxID=3064388 RepID=A0ABT9IWR5_9BACL|nr:hypothetical protein [Chengkuizengella sp. 2205SS18-9]MDP5273542.1 hypothetical protein [Chengkuizengella sp. 2205SS18-9]